MLTAADERYCKGCEHNERFLGEKTCCMYVANTHKLRPCPAGVGCTERRRKRKKKYYPFREGL